MTASDLKTPDAAARSIVDRVPARVRPYLRLMRVDRPVGVWLLFLPCLWGLIAARPDGTSVDTIFGLGLLCLIGAFMMRSAGCVYNDLVDRDIDRQVARTAARPIAAGVVSVRAALVLITGLSLAGLCVLLALPQAALLPGLAALLPVAAYPFMKRITWWPQAFLGITFNWGVLVGAAAISGRISLADVVLFAAGACWTLGYDTIYALQDREDDALAGVRSSARRLGTAVRPAVGVFYVVATGLLALTLWLRGAGALIVLAVLPGAHLAWQVLRLRPDDSAQSLDLFRSNVAVGWLVAFALLAA